MIEQNSRPLPDPLREFLDRQDWLEDCRIRREMNLGELTFEEYLRRCRDEHSVRQVDDGDDQEELWNYVPQYRAGRV